MVDGQIETDDSHRRSPSPSREPVGPTGVSSLDESLTESSSGQGGPLQSFVGEPSKEDTVTETLSRLSQELVGVTPGIFRSG